MRIQSCLVALLVCMLIVASPASSAQAASPNISRFKYKDEAAIVYFSGSTDGCIYTVTGLMVGQLASQSSPGAPNTDITINVDISQIDLCQVVFLSGASGFAILPAGAFQIDKQLTAARLQGTLPMQSYTTGETFDLALDLTWTGQGDRSRERDNSHYQAAGCHLSTRFNGLFRDATVTGSLRSGATDYAANMLSRANLQSVNGGVMEIGCTA